MGIARIAFADGTVYRGRSVGAEGTTVGESAGVGSMRFVTPNDVETMLLDWGTLKWCQAYASPPNGCYDAETIALDEFGHVEGLNHHVNFFWPSPFCASSLRAAWPGPMFPAPHRCPILKKHWSPGRTCGVWPRCANQTGQATSSSRNCCRRSAM